VVKSEKSVNSQWLRSVILIAELDVVTAFVNILALAHEELLKPPDILSKNFLKVAVLSHIALGLGSRKCYSGQNVCGLGSLAYIYTEKHHKWDAVLYPQKWLSLRYFPILYLGKVVCIFLMTMNALPHF
jgi:hypothetical protein